MHSTEFHYLCWINILENNFICHCLHVPRKSQKTSDWQCYAFFVIILQSLKSYLYWVGSLKMGRYNFEHDEERKVGDQDGFWKIKEMVLTGKCAVNNFQNHPLISIGEDHRHAFFAPVRYNIFSNLHSAKICSKNEDHNLIWRQSYLGGNWISEIE